MTTMFHGLQSQETGVWNGQHVCETAAKHDLILLQFAAQHICCQGGGEKAAAKTA